MTIQSHYTNPSHVIGFSGVNTAYRYSNQKNRKQIKNRLSHRPTYVFHREVKRPRVYNPYILYRPRVLLQGDLIDMISRADFNQGVKYVLVVVDSFTRFCWAEPLYDKSAKNVLQAFRKIYGKTGEFKRFMSDAGKEFLSKNFQLFLKEKEIQYVRGNPHAPHVERLNRTLQGKLFRYMTENENNKWLSALPKIVSSYNSRRHRMIGMSPKQAESSKNRSELIKNVSKYYEKAIKKKRKPKFKIGDIVSMQKDKSVFGKGYTQVFTDELFKIYKIHLKLPIPMYTLVDYDHNLNETDPEIIEKNIVRGRFYENELQLANFDVFKVEKILKERMKNGVKSVLVKWKGWPKKYNSWEPKSNIVKTFKK